MIRGSLTIATDGRVEVRDLAIASPSHAAVLARGGQLAIENVDITTALGVGVALEDVEAELTNVSIAGAIDLANPPSLSVDFGIDDASTHGIVAAGGTTALTNVDVRGTAAACALFAGGAVTWNGGAVSDALGIGVLADGGSAAISDVSIDGIVQGFALPPAYGVVFVGAGSYSTSSVRVAGTQGIGLAQIESSAVHTDLEASGNSVAGVWVERADVELTGNLHDNTFAGFVAVETPHLDVHDATIDNTHAAVRQVELLGSIEVGDGLQVVSPSLETTIDGVTMSGNERAGLLLDLPSAFGTLSLTDIEITVTSSGAVAAVAQGSPPAGWDGGITRDGTTAAADQARTGTFDVLDVIAPCDRPRGLEVGDLQDLGL